MNFIELQNFSFNATTVSFLVVLATNLFGAWALVRQTERIFRAKSGLSVSIPLFIFSAMSYFAVWAFGSQLDSLSMLSQVLCRLPFMFVILIGLYKYEGFKRLDWVILFACSFLSIYFLNVDNPGVYFSAISIFAGAFTLHQAWTIVQNRSRGEVELSFLIVTEVAVLFWMVYGFAIHQQHIWLPSLLHVHLYGIVIICWFLFPNRRNDKVSSSS